MAYIRSGFLTDNIEEYTKFLFDGYQIQLPYYWGGKESASTIRANLSTLCGGSGSGKTEAQIQAIATDNETLVSFFVPPMKPVVATMVSQTISAKQPIALVADFQLMNPQKYATDGEYPRKF